MKQIQELLEQVEKLRILLNDPHPGLVTWNIAVAQQIQKIAAFA